MMSDDSHAPSRPLQPSGTFRPEVIADSLATLFGWYAEGKLKPHLSHVLPLDRTDEALELLRSRRSTGKVVVTMG